MGDVKGFLKARPEAAEPSGRCGAHPGLNEVYEEFPGRRAPRGRPACMDCGIPFCQQRLSAREHHPDWTTWCTGTAGTRPSSGCTPPNNFPEFTGRLCPGTVRIRLRARHQRGPVTIKQFEVSIIRCVRGPRAGVAPGSPQPL